MAEQLDFLGLRAEVEAATRIPEFRAVERRARRVRARDRLAVAGALLGTLVVVTPVSVAAMHARQQGRGPTVLGPDHQTPAPIGLTPPTRPLPGPVQVHTKAVDGIDVTALWAAVDVCAEPSSPSQRDGTRYAVAECSLQVSGVRTDGQSAPVMVGGLRESGTETLSDVQLVALSRNSLLLSGVPDGGTRLYLRVSVTGGGVRPSTPAADGGGLSPGDRMVQLSAHGEIYAVHQADDRFVRLPAQPPLSAPSAVTSTEPARGWWVTGLDPVTGEVAVSVSRDLGRTWTTHALGLMPGIEAPTLITGDGRVAYLFVHTGTGITQYRTTDGGTGWANVPATMPWPSAGGASGQAGRAGADPRRFGAVVRPDGAVLAWLEDTPAPVYLLSTDGGVTYRGAAGPTGRVVAVPGGYVAISDRPAVSRDAVTWTPLVTPGYLPPR
jgi:hypothetical protein